MKNRVLSLVSRLAVSIVVITLACQSKARAFRPAADQIRQYIVATEDQDALRIMSVTRVLSDAIGVAVETNQYQEVKYRDAAVNEVADALSRMQSRYPVVMGGPGSGKTAVIGETIKRALFDELASAAQEQALKDLVVFQISARKFMPGGPLDLDYYLAVVKNMSRKLNLNIMVYLTDAEFMSEYNASVLHERATGPEHVPVLIETDFKSYSQTLSSLESLKPLLAVVQLPDLSQTQLVDLIKSTALPKIEQRYKIKIGDDLIAAAVDISPDYNRASSEPQRSIMLIEDFAIDFLRNRSSRDATPTKKDLYKFVAQKMGVPVVPQDEEAFTKYIEDVRKGLHEDIVDQDELVDGLVDQFRNALTSRDRMHSVAMVMGSTGVGKTYTAEQLAERFYGSKSRLLELDMTQFMHETDVSVLFGASNGLISSDKDKGVICEFLDGRGRGGGVIILNEIEKAHSSIITRLMELFDKGEVRCGDGKVRYLGHSLIVMTSNKNTERILPPEAIANLTPEEIAQRKARITPDDLKKAFTEKASYTDESSSTVTTPVVERVDRWYFAWPLLRIAAEKVANKEVAKFVRNYEKHNNRKLDVDKSFGQVIVSAMYNQQNGARQVSKAVSQSLTNAIEDFKVKYGANAAEFKISAKLHPSKKTESFVTIVDPQTNQELTIDGPSVPVVNKLLDANFRRRLTDLEANLNKQIFGQPEAVSAVTAAITSKYLRANDTRPASIFLMGTTGTGKSEIARMVAKYLFGRPDAVGKFDMGRVQDKLDLGNIFSPAKGVIGSDEPGELEKFLLQFPDGGVLLFDEASNAGGNDMAIKNAVFKQFYNFLQEGYYISPSGKKYDLSKYLIIFTGNDGEELFKGAGSESMINHIYKEIMKHPEKARSILREKGFSDAFLGRLSSVVVTRPATGAVKLMITNKMLNSWKASVESAQPIDIEFAPGVIEKVSRLMFTYKSGARSIEQFIDNVLGKQVSKLALDLNWDHLIESGTRAKFTVEMDTIEPNHPFYEGDKPDQKEAVLKVKAIQDGKSVGGFETEFTNFASFMPQVHVNRARATAYHEMGHAVAAFTDLTGHKVERISIIPQEFFAGMALGVTEYEKVPVKGDMDWNSMVAQVAGLLAGSEAEMLSGTSQRNTGRSNDVERAGALARQIILERHLVPGLDDAHAYLKNGDIDVTNLPPATRDLLAKKVKQAIRQARRLAIRTLRENWHVVDAGAQLLLQHHELNGEQFQQLLDAGAAAKNNAGQIKRTAIRAGLINAKNVYPIDRNKIDMTADKPAAKSDVHRGACEKLLRAG